MAILVYVSGTSKDVQKDQEIAVTADRAEELRVIKQKLDIANKIWDGWLLRCHGKAIAINGSDFTFQVPADELSSLPALLEQYSDFIGGRVNVGVGIELSEADKARQAAERMGQDIRLYDDTVLEDLEDEKNLKKAGEEKAASAGAPDYVPAAALSGAPVPEQGSSGPESPQMSPPDDAQVAPMDVDMAHQEIHRAADQQQTTDAFAAHDGAQQDARSEHHKSLKAQVAASLAVLKSKAEILESIKEQDPELYQSLVGIVKSMVELVREHEQVAKAEKIELNGAKFAPKVLSKDLMPGGKGDNKPDSDFDAEQLKIGIRTEMEEHGLDEARAAEVAKDHLSESPTYYSEHLDKKALTGRHNLNLPPGSQIDPGPQGDKMGGKIVVRLPLTGKKGHRSARAGVVMAPDGTATSARNPRPKSSQPPEPV